eukprot:TRINITY_DN1685_c2_g1_i1.p1 TRINITY_DN1685_c2_g1~~TRINITY_DN1685_c2_g1_i1.p1  ORF type:complete len:528 (+),score=82.60 TRINITY_DN1685_c2_g1_i1:93-1586(+)
MVYHRYAEERQGEGRITFDQFKVMVKQTGLGDFGEGSLLQVFNQVDKDKNGTIEKSEFLHWWPSVCQSYQHASNPMAAYDVLVSSEEIRRDDKQWEALLEFQRVFNQLKAHVKKVEAYEQQTSSRGGLLSMFSTPPPAPHISDIRGLYVHGGVGCGKSFMMDLFFDKIDGSKIKKRRVHFNAFMLEVHESIHNTKKNNPKSDGIEEVVAKISNEVQLLCFDEFQVTDIADAMLLRRLFENLFSKGLVMAATSNRKPDDLYEHGLRRESFVPFIKFLKQKCVVHSLDSETDYRKENVRLAETTYFHPLNASTEKQLMHTLEAITGGKPMLPTNLTVFGRDVPIRAACDGVASCTFDDLCRKPLSTADYGAIARNYHTIFVSGIPSMTISERTEARRFIYLIDELYENKVKLICTAASLPDVLFSGKGLEGILAVDLEAADALGVDASKDTSLFNGSDEVFAFGRAVSRINEMQTKEYLQLPHSKLQATEAYNSWLNSL